MRAPVDGTSTCLATLKDHPVKYPPRLVSLFFWKNDNFASAGYSVNIERISNGKLFTILFLVRLLMNFHVYLSTVLIMEVARARVCLSMNGIFVRYLCLVGNFARSRLFQGLRIKFHLILLTSVRPKKALLLRVNQYIYI